MKVYIISTYEEHGAEEVRATLDKSKVRDLLVTHPKQAFPMSYEYEKRLAELLEKDMPVDGANLGRGWGGFQLHIVELE